MFYRYYSSIILKELHKDQQYLCLWLRNEEIQTWLKFTGAFYGKRYLLISEWRLCWVSKPKVNLPVIITKYNLNCTKQVRGVQLCCFYPCAVHGIDIVRGQTDFLQNEKLFFKFQMNPHVPYCDVLYNWNWKLKRFYWHLLIGRIELADAVWNWTTLEYIVLFLWLVRNDTVKRSCNLPSRLSGESMPARWGASCNSQFFQ